MTAGKHLNQDYAQGPNVAALVDGFAEDLLGGHVRERPGGRDTLRGANGGNNAGEAEVHDLGHLVIGNDNVRRLDVAMHDIARMSRAESPCNLDGEVEGFADRNHATRQFLRQSLSLVVTHDDEKLVFFRLLDSMNDTDVRMIQSGSGARFAKQALSVAIADGDVRGQELQGDRALELQVERLVHHTHAAGA